MVCVWLQSQMLELEWLFVLRKVNQMLQLQSGEHFVLEFTFLALPEEAKIIQTVEPSSLRMLFTGLVWIYQHSSFFLVCAIAKSIHSLIQSNFYDIHLHYICLKKAHYNLSTHVEHSLLIIAVGRANYFTLQVIKWKLCVVFYSNFPFFTFIYSKYEFYCITLWCQLKAKCISV